MALPASAARADPAGTPPSQRRHRWGRVASHGLSIVALVLVLSALAGVVLAHSFDPDAFKPRIEAAVLRATGRTLTIGGQLRIGLFNGPRLKATDVSLGNLPDGSRPEMVRVAEVKARLSFSALLTGRVEIIRLDLVRPDLILEITPSGEPNWRFAPPSRPPNATAPAQPPGSARPAGRIIVREVRISDGAAVLADDRTGRRLDLRLNSVLATAASAADPLTLAANVTAAGTVLRLNATMGPPHPAAVDPGAAAGNAPPDGAAAWPVKLDLTALGAQVALAGTVDPGTLLGGQAGDRPRPFRYDLALIANLQNLTNLAPLLPGVTVPPLRDVHLKLAMAGARGELPELRQLDLSSGHADLGGVVPGLAVDQVSIVGAGMEAPLRGKAAGSYAGAAFSLAVDLGAPAALRPGPPEKGPFPIGLSASAGGARLTATGGILHPRSLQGLDLAVEARVPELAALAPLLHRAVPPLQNLAVQARVTDGADGLRQGVTLRGVHVTTPGSDAGAELRLAWSPRPAVAGEITAASLNAGDLATAFANRIAPPPPLAAAAAAASAAVPPAPSAARSAAPSPGASAAAPPERPRLLSDQPIRFDRWMATDVDLRLAAKTVTWPDEVWRNLGGHLRIADRRLRLESGAADLPAGHAEATLDVDAAPPLPVVSLMLRAPGVSVQPLLALLNLPEAATGRLEVDAALHALGHSPHALAAAADGTVGLAMVGGSVDGGDAQAWLAEVLRRAALPDGARLSGHTAIDCLALRLDVSRGLGSWRALALQTPLLSLSGGGAVNLAEETVAMRVRAVANVGIGVAVPFDIAGPLRAPKVRLNIAGGAASALEGAAGLMIGRLGGDGAAALGGPSCASELAAARGGWAGKQPTAAAAAPPRVAAPSPRPSEPGAKVFRWMLR